MKVTPIDAEAPGARASGNTQGALYVKLAAETNPASRFQLAALQYSRRWLASLDPEQTLWSASGVLQLATSERERKRQQRFADNHPLPEALLRPVTAGQASQIAGSEITFDGLFYPVAGWVRPKALCQHLAATPGISFRQARIVAIQSLGAEEDGGSGDAEPAPRWQLQASDGSCLEVDQLIVALGSRLTCPSRSRICRCSRFVVRSARSRCHPNRQQGCPCSTAWCVPVAMSRPVSVTPTAA